MIRQFDTLEPLPRSVAECGRRTQNYESCGLAAGHDGPVHAVVSLSGLVIRTFPERSHIECGDYTCPICAGY